MPIVSSIGDTERRPARVIRLNDVESLRKLSLEENRCPLRVLAQVPPLVLRRRRGDLFTNASF